MLPPGFQTARLILRPIEAGDAGAIFDGIGYDLFATGLVGVFLSAAIVGVFMGGSGGEDAQSYDATRLVILIGLSWLAVAWVLWRAERTKLLVSIVGVAAIGFGLGVFALGDLNAGG